MYLSMDKVSFGEWLRKQREDRGLSQSDLARISGLHRQIINKTENGVSDPALKTYIALSVALNLSLITVLRVAGELPPGPDDKINFEDWQYMLEKMTPEERDGIRLKETDRAIVGRASMFGDDLRMICQLAGVEYKSPHKLRHGHIVYARSLARDMDDVKAISQNVMHSSIVITDQVYGNLKTSQVQGGILNLGISSELDKAELLHLLETLIKKLSHNTI